MSKENTTTYIILGLLSHEASSGYDLKKKIDFMISRFWEVGYGQIYPTLRQMESDGLVNRCNGETSKGPEKSIYSITEIGKITLNQWLSVQKEKEYTKYEILLKLFFGSKLPLEENVRRILAFRERHQDNLSMIQIFKGNLEQVLGKDPDHLYYYLTVMFGEQIYKAYMAWADEAVKLLEKSETDRNNGGHNEKTET